MKLIETLLPDPVVDALGWMILHSLWQGAIISVILGLIMILTNKFSAKSRYFIAVTSFLFIPASAIYTYIKNYDVKEQVQVSLITSLKDNIVNEEDNQAISENPVLMQTAQENEGNLKLKSYKKYFSQHLPLIVTVWLLGMLVFALKFLGGLAYTQRLKHYRIYQVTEEWQKIFDRLCQTLKVKQAVKIFQSAMVKVPMVVGFFKPVVLIPVSAFTGIPPKQLETIIMHELAHIIRRDYIINILQSLIEIIFFYHPAVWWMSKVIRAEREHCCDDIAIEKTGDSVSFVKALANIQEQFLMKENLAMTINGGNNNLFKRIKRLLNQPNMKTSFTEGFTASCIIFAGILIMILNTGATKNISSEYNISLANPIKTEAIKNIDDSTKVKSAVRKDEPVTAEDQLFELENKENDRESNQKDKQAEEKQNEADKAKQYAVQKQKEAEKARMEAELKKSEAEKAKQYAEQKQKEAGNIHREEDISEEEILKGVQAGLEEMDLNKIANEAMDGARAGINAIDLNLIVREAIDGVNEGIHEINSDDISREILSGIEAACEQMDLNVIASEVLSGIRLALDEIDVNKIVDSQINNKSGQENFSGDSEHLHIIKSGVGEWNKWRKENPKIVPDLTGAVLTEANLNSADLHNAILNNIDLKEAVLDWANLEGASLRYAMLKEASFNGTKLEGADMTGANLKEVSLSGLNLQNTILKNADLKEADLSMTDFRNSDLSYANMGEADLRKADLRDANIKGTNISEAKLSGVNFEGAIADEYTQFPEGFNPTAKGIKMQK